MASDYQRRTYTPTPNPTHLNYDRERSAADGVGSRWEVSNLDADGEHHRLGAVGGNLIDAVRNSCVLRNQRRHSSVARGPR